MCIIDYFLSNKCVMQLFCGLYNLQFLVGGCVVIIGNFDGVYFGYQVILVCLCECLLELGVFSCVVIFELQLCEFFFFDLVLVCLICLCEKFELLCGQGVDVVFCLVFNCCLCELLVVEFVCQVLVDGLVVWYLEVGDDFCFGCDCFGDFVFLVNVSCEQGFIVEVVVIVELDGVWVSSMWVCQVLVEGDLYFVECFLGCFFSLSGWVLYGQKFGW